MPMHISIWFVNRCTTQTHWTKKNAWKLKWIKFLEARRVCTLYFEGRKATLRAKTVGISHKLQAFFWNAKFGPLPTHATFEEKIQEPAPPHHPAAPYWAMISKLRSLLTFPSSLVGAWRRLTLKHPPTHKDPCSSFHHTKIHVGILAHLFHHMWGSLLNFSLRVVLKKLALPKMAGKKKDMFPLMLMSSKKTTSKKGGFCSNQIPR